MTAAVAPRPRGAEVRGGRGRRKRPKWRFRSLLPKTEKIPESSGRKNPRRERCQVVPGRQVRAELGHLEEAGKATLGGRLWQIRCLWGSGLSRGTCIPGLCHICPSIRPLASAPFIPECVPQSSRVQKEGWPCRGGTLSALHAAVGKGAAGARSFSVKSSGSVSSRPFSHLPAPPLPLPQ